MSDRIKLSNIEVNHTCKILQKIANQDFISNKPENEIILSFYETSLLLNFSLNIVKQYLPIFCEAKKDDLLAIPAWNEFVEIVNTVNKAIKSKKENTNETN